MRGFLWAFSFFLVSCLWIGCKGICDGVTCNNGECADGECVCDDGYEGENCELTANAKFSGQYAFSRICDSTGGPFSDTIIVAPSAGSTDLFTLSGLAGGPQVDARVLSDGVEFQIARQSFGPGKEIESISGTISTDAETINLNFRILDSATDSLVDRCSGSMTKQ